jgi:tRNA(fMet)-specific endonuclease VapC
VIYLLDTNACIAIINGRPPQVRIRLEQVSSTRDEIATSSVVVFELWYGVAKSARPEMNTKRLEAFLAGPIDCLDLNEQDAREAGRIRSALEATGRPIGAYDVLVAGQALCRGASLVTANVSEFARVTGLKWEDWTAT